jgi:hypothetical protein
MFAVTSTNLTQMSQCKHACGPSCRCLKCVFFILSFIIVSVSFLVVVVFVVVVVVVVVVDVNISIDIVTDNVNN